MLITIVHGDCKLNYKWGAPPCSIKFHELLGFWGFLGNIGYQGHDATFGAVYAHKGCTKKLEHHGLHGFALDQPSINGISQIHRSEKWKRSEKNALRKNVFFWEIAGWTSFGLIMFPTVSDRIRPYPTVSDRFRPFPTVSIFLSDELDQFRLWKADPVQTRANHDAQVFSCNLCARTLPQMSHRDLDIQYSLKIPKSQELVKFDTL